LIALQVIIQQACGQPGIFFLKEKRDKTFISITIG